MNDLRMVDRDNLISDLRGEMRYHEPLARYTSWRIGGPAERFYLPADREDLGFFMASLPETEPLTWLGLGSNVLVSDRGIAGTVVHTRGQLRGLMLQDDGQVYVEAGVPCAHVARFCGEHGLVGAEFLAGIPGTMGGALAMNAGAFGGETWPLVSEALVLGRRGLENWRQPESFRIGYRSVEGLQNGWFAAARLRLQSGDSVASQARIKALLAERSLRQPMGQPSCGSVFRNPPGDHAARLIDACGLKGLVMGGAQVSPKHANFIINTGTASCEDVLGLIRHIQQTVEKESGIRLETEVRVLGERING